ncbi:Uncharacterized protein C8035_v003640 [Colletotrichum spinosum]|uniref:NAD-dependent epimerase/dehydratase domain-containing protein n=1 Tax=Colletotrichum spinosum TaxID=1347390 RepID=A0A4V3HTW9_9PEZI|nr:Uncharacterized protein C8035_v003640 [Colletotrichum spinosum]
MTLKIFLTGVTGYVGGDAFYTLYEKHPEYDYSLLVRTEERAGVVRKAYPNVRIVIGSNSDSEILEEEAAAADVVIHTADSADDVPSAQAITKGLANGHSAEKPGYYIHLSGTGILIWYDQVNERYGEAPLPEQEYHDIRDISRLLSLPDDAVHRNVEKVVLAANSSSPAVRTAVLLPPTIYGTGRGPQNRRSIQIPALARATLEKGFAPVVAPGQTEWDNIHVHDLSNFFTRLVEATQDAKLNSDQEVFGAHGYFILESGTHKWADVAAWIAEEAHAQGFLPAPLTKEVTMKEVLHSGPVAGSWALNSKGRTERAKKYLGFETKAKSVKEEIPELIKREATILHLQPHEKH